MSELKTVGPVVQGVPVVPSPQVVPSVPVVPSPQVVPVARTLNLKLNPKFLRTIEIPNPNQPLADLLLDQLKAALGNEPLSQHNILKAVTQAVLLAQKLKRSETEPLSPDEKKSIIMSVIQRIVNETVTDETDKSYLLDLFIPMFLSGAIDHIVAPNNAQNQVGGGGCCW